MKLIKGITDLFVWGIGITKPKPGQERRAGLYIASLLFGSLAFIALVFTLFVLRR